MFLCKYAYPVSPEDRADSTEESPLLEANSYYLVKKGPEFYIHTFYVT
jgi:hypothetical protein